MKINIKEKTKAIFTPRVLVIIALVVVLVAVAIIFATE
jgi:hypothetical protein